MEIIIILSGLFNIALGIICLKNAPKNIVNQTFALFSAITGAWVIAAAMLKIFPSYLTGSIALILGLSLSVSFVLFIKEYPASKRTATLFFYLPIIIMFGFMMVGYFTKTFLTGVNIKDGFATPVFGPLFMIIQIFIYPYLIYGFIKLFKNYRKSIYTEKLKMRYLIVVLVGFIACLATMNGILPAMGIYGYVDLGTISAVFWSYLIFYAISKSTLFSLRYIAGNTLYMLFKLVILVTAIYSILKTEEIYIGGIYSNTSIMLNILLAFISTILFPKICSKFLGFLSRYIINTNYNPVVLANTFRDRISKELSLEKICNIFIETIKRSISPLGFCITIYDIDKHKIQYSKYIFFEEDIHDKFDNLLNNSKGLPTSVLIRETFQDDKTDYGITNSELIYKYMKDYKIALIYPIVVRHQVRGFVFFKDMNINKAYTTESIMFLDNIIISFTLAIERSLLYSELEGLNVNLQDKIDIATKELKEKFTELNLAYKKERDMLDILGHELRTPLSIGRNSVQFMKTMLKNDVLTKEKTKQYLEIASESLEREVSLLETLLSTTKIDNKRMNLSFEKVDLNDVINDSIFGLKEKAEKRELKLTFNNQKDSFVYADRTRIQEVSDNLIDNAIKYTDKGGVTISIDFDNDFTKVIIADTGRGISKEDINNLGQKFYRADNYLHNEMGDLKIIRPGGTGLGLYVTFSLIKAMGGKIKVESKIKEGSTFSVYFQKYTGQKPKFTSEERPLDRSKSLK